MNPDSDPQQRVTARRNAQFWLHLAVGIALLLLAAVTDITKPLGKSWTILYLLPVLYVGWKIRGRTEAAFYAVAIATTFVVPMVFRPQLLWGGTGFFNRALGTAIGVLVIFLIWERRRYVKALEKSNEELETRVALRVRELEIANQTLAEDIRQRRQAEQELRESESRFRTFVDHATDAFFLHDEQGIVRDVNEQACESLGYTRDEIIGMHPMQFDPELTRERMEHIAAGLDAGQTMRFDSIHRRKDNSQFPVELRIRPFRSQGRCFRVALARDISERKQAEEERKKLAEQRQQAQMLESLGVLAGGIAHDFNNLLTVINGNCHLLRTKLAENDSNQAFAAAIQAAGTQAAKLMRQLLMFSRGVSQEPTMVDVNEMVEQSGEIWQQVVGKKIEMVVDCAENLWPVVVDKSQIEQVLLNLVLNARDAMPNGGRLVVKTRNAELPVERVDSTGGPKSGNHETSRFIQILVEDTGVGMSESVRARVFDPFFTTKIVGQGTGLGLPMCHGIVKQSGGWIDVSSKPGSGSTFFVTLPSKPNVNPALAERQGATAAAASSQ
jgi:PAS domain S-box-containing protein